MDTSQPVHVTDDELAELLEFAVSAAQAAGKEALPYFRASIAVENKLGGGAFDPVTQADKNVEAALRALIQEAYPEHGLLGEEYGERAGNGLTWVIDPIDGTRAFMTGMLHWGVLVALYNGEDAVLGVMHQPFTEETWLGDNRKAEYRRGGEVVPLSVRTGVALNEAVLTTTSPVFFTDESELAAFRRLEARAQLTRYGGDCYIYAMLAMGLVDAATDPGLNPYDIQALIPIIRGAGGLVTRWDGGNPCAGGAVIACGSPALLEECLAELGR